MAVFNVEDWQLNARAVVKLYRWLDRSTLFYMAFACCANLYMMSVHTSST